MKKTAPIILVLTMLVSTSNLSFAQSISLNEAREVAKNQLLMAGISNAKSGTSKSGVLKLAPLKRENIQLKAAKAEVQSKDTLYYVLNDSVNNAFVIVSADKRVWPILGYSTNGIYSEKNQPEAYVAWMENRKKEIAYSIENNLPADAQTREKWRQLTVASNASQTAAVEPLLKTTWDQGCYYNEQCPADAEAVQGACGHVPTGCTATAMAQIMKYWNYPTIGVGSYKSITSYGYQIANFGATTYQWSQMPNYLSEPNSEVAKLMFHCGVASQTFYHIDGSASTTSNAANGLIRYFSYSNKLKEVSKDSVLENWVAKLKFELDSRRPILYSGSGSASHAFVCDGYQSGNYFHFNWGWGGLADGYFYIGKLNPAGESFDEYQSAIINICPDDLPQGYNGFYLETNDLQLFENKSTTKVISSVNWNATSNQSWLVTNLSAGNPGATTLEFTAEENDTGIPRVATVTVSTAEYGIQIITITQMAKTAVTAGELRNVLAGKLKEVSSIHLVGTIDARDFKTMRDEMPLLENIDLSNTSIVEYVGTEGTISNEMNTYKANTIPSYSFAKKSNSSTSNLYHFSFPLTTISIDSYAFNACVNLATIDIPRSIQNHCCPNF